MRSEIEFFFFTNYWKTQRLVFLKKKNFFIAYLNFRT